MELAKDRSNPGFDGRASNSKTIQVKAKGPSMNQIAFSYSEEHADHLLVIELDFDRGTGCTIYKGPECYVREFLPKERWRGQKHVSLSQLRKAAKRILDDERLPMLRLRFIWRAASVRPPRGRQSPVQKSRRSVTGCPLARA